MEILRHFFLTISGGRFNWRVECVRRAVQHNKHYRVRVVRYGTYGTKWSGTTDTVYGSEEAFKTVGSRAKFYVPISMDTYMVRVRVRSFFALQYVPCVSNPVEVFEFLLRSFIMTLAPIRKSNAVRETAATYCINTNSSHLDNSKSNAPWKKFGK